MWWENKYRHGLSTVVGFFSEETAEETIPGVSSGNADLTRFVVNRCNTARLTPSHTQ